MSEIHGHVTSVAREVRGDELTAAASLGATVLSVGDTADFNDEQAGSVLINGETYGYDETGVDHDANTLTLTSGLLTAVAEGDRVECYLPETNEVVSEWVATVTDDHDGSPLEIPISHALIKHMDNVVSALANESVACERDSDGQWWVTRVLGKPPFASIEYQPHSLRTRSTNNPVLDSTWTQVVFDEIEGEDGIIFRLIGAGGYFWEMPRAGVLTISAYEEFASTPTGRRELRIERDGVTMGHSSISASTAVDALSVSATFTVEAGTLVQIRSYQNTGSSLNVTSGRAALIYLG